MDTASAFLWGSLSKNDPLMVFDWIKAAKLIKERQPKLARAGLANDWEYTGGTIYRDGELVDDYTYLASTWAVPQLELDRGELVECWVYQSERPDWDAKTTWPEEAKEIL